jgi:lysozyme family protein
MESNFDTAIAYILHDEGGYAERENEPGGAGNRGISYTLFKEMWAKEKRGVPTFDDLKAVDDVEAARLYKKFVFPLVSFNEMPPGLDYLMVNLATMQGPTGAIRLLQETMGMDFMSTTGKLDQKTWDNIKDWNPYKLVGGLQVLQDKYKMNDSRVGTWRDSKTGKEMKGFGPGWGNRAWRTWNRAVGMIPA